jgi:energy-converting hydrogenase Eha subunit B
MIGDAIAGWIGNRIDRRDGKGGTIGALAGVLTWKATKRIVPAALVLGAVAYGVHKLSQSSNPPI